MREGGALVASLLFLFLCGFGKRGNAISRTLSIENVIVSFDLFFL